LLQLRKDVERLTAAESRSATAQQQLLAAQQEAARLSGQLEAKARHIASLESELAQAQQQQGISTASQQKLQQDLAAAQAEVGRLQGQVTEVIKLRTEVNRVQVQLDGAGQREAQLLQQLQEAQQASSQLTGQVSGAYTRLCVAVSGAHAAVWHNCGALLNAVRHQILAGVGSARCASHTTSHHINTPVVMHGIPTPAMANLPLAGVFALMVLLRVLMPAQVTAAQQRVSRLEAENAAGRTELSEVRGQLNEVKQKLQEAESHAATFQVGLIMST
jgi:chromosome segregation ATPase